MTVLYAISLTFSISLFSLARQRVRKGEKVDKRKTWLARKYNHRQKKIVFCCFAIKCKWFAYGETYVSLGILQYNVHCYFIIALYCFVSLKLFTQLLCCHIYSRYYGFFVALLVLAINKTARGCSLYLVSLLLYVVFLQITLQTTVKRIESVAYSNILNCVHIT